MKKVKKILALCCCLVMCVLVVGCQGKSGSKKIAVNLAKSEITLTKVSYYDFFENENVYSYTGKCYVISGSLNSTEIWFMDTNGETRVMCVDKKLSNKPSTVKVYKNKGKTSYDTYECTY